MFERLNVKVIELYNLKIKQKFVEFLFTSEPFFLFYLINFNLSKHVVLKKHSRAPL